MRDSKLPVMMGFKLKDDDAPTARGVLLKRGQFNKHWRDYDVDVRDGQLFYGPSGSKGKKIIDLRAYTVANVGGHGSEAFDLVFEVKTLHLAATTRDDLQMWTTVIKLAIAGNLAAPVPAPRAKQSCPPDMPQLCWRSHPWLNWQRRDVPETEMAATKHHQREWVLTRRQDNKAGRIMSAGKRRPNSPSPRHLASGAASSRATRCLERDDGDAQLILTRRTCAVARTFGRILRRRGSHHRGGPARPGSKQKTPTGATNDAVLGNSHTRQLGGRLPGGLSKTRTTEGQLSPVPTACCAEPTPEDRC